MWPRLPTLRPAIPEMVETLSSHSRIHLAVDGIAELAAILGPATLALVTFGGAAAAAAEPTLANLFYWLKGTETASFALGEHRPAIRAVH